MWMTLSRTWRRALRPHAVKSPLTHGADGTVRTCRIGDFVTENGDVIPNAHIAFETFGTLNAEATNAILIEHALTGDSHVTAGASDTPGWWEDVVGPGKAIDTREFFVVCTNVLGGCNGSTGPSTPVDDIELGAAFPQVSIRDMVRAEALVADALGIERFYAVVGGSLGGARATEFAAAQPHRVERTVVLAAPAYSSADNIAWAHTQLQAIRLDPNYHGGNYAHHSVKPLYGLGLARQIAHLTYRSGDELDGRFGREHQPSMPGYYQVQSYLDYQAGKLVGRFDAQSYCVLTRALRDHDVRRGRSQLTVPGLHVVSLSSDRLYPPSQVKELAGLAGAHSYTEVETDAGHDGFLTESAEVSKILRSVLG